MVARPNATASSRWDLDLKPEELQKSTCVLGVIPVVYYSVLLCVGVPGTAAKGVTQHHTGYSRSRLMLASLLVFFGGKKRVRFC